MYLFIVVISYDLDFYADILLRCSREVRKYFSCLHSLAAHLFIFLGLYFKPSVTNSELFQVQC